jgi:UDP-glucose 4-epimerase
MWKNKEVLVTGGASFIGSHLVDTLLKKGSLVTVADDLSSGKIENLEYPLQKGKMENYWSYGNLNLWVGDLKDKSFI